MYEYVYNMCMTIHKKAKSRKNKPLTSRREKWKMSRKRIDLTLDTKYINLLDKLKKQEKKSKGKLVEMALEKTWKDPKAALKEEIKELAVQINIRQDRLKKLEG